MSVFFLAQALNSGVFHSKLQFLGIGIVVLGIVLREWSVLSLGRFFTVSVMVAGHNFGKAWTLSLATPSCLFRQYSQPGWIFPIHRDLGWSFIGSLSQFYWVSKSCANRGESIVGSPR